MSIFPNGTVKDKLAQTQNELCKAKHFKFSKSQREPVINLSSTS